MAIVAGERRIVTVLFADIVGSTAIGERLGPERTKLVLDEVLRVMGAEVERFGGTIAQFVGDELYAVFGAPVAHEDDSERAVRAAMSIHAALARYAGDVNEAYGVDLAARIAINTGPVVIRPDSEDPYNALGETVNVAARIQKLVDGGEIVVGRETKVQIEHCIAVEGLGEQDLRGVTAPVETFRVIGVRADAKGAPKLPLVGRDFELSMLERGLDGLVDGRGIIVSIVGEPGIGKSRLIAELRHRFGDRVRFIEGRAVSYAQSLPFWPVRDLLREWLGVGADAPEARVRLELKAELARLLDQDAEAAYPLIGSLLGITLEPDAAERLRDLSRESFQRQAFEFFYELVCRLAAGASVCLVFEDLHWADDSTLELLEELLGVTEEAGIGLVFCHRSEREHGSWRLGERARQRYPHRYREVELRPLPDDASRALAAGIVGADLPDDLGRLLASRSGGNPFFLEEALHDLLERGALVRDNGRMHLTVPLDDLALPTLVQGALQARLDRLAPATRDVLSVASVIGRSFGLHLVEQVLGEVDVIEALSELQRLDLIVEDRRRPAPEYSFRHGLVQEVAYASLLDGKRKRLHGQVGEALEALHGDAPDEVYGLLARHFSEADAAERAVEYLLKAGDAARAVYADEEAVEHYRRARSFLARLGDEHRARQTLFKLALVHHLAFDFEQAELAYDEAFCCRAEEPVSYEPTERLETAIMCPDAFDPSRVYSTEGMQVIESLFRGLVTVDSDLNVVPDLADNFRVSSDGCTYLFRLGEGARWSDGHPLKAEDFAYTWKRMREERLPTSFLHEDVATATALDDRTLEIRLHEPRSYFPYLLTAPWFFPWPKHLCESLGEAWREPENLVGNGPFVVSRLDEHGAELSANPYWRGPRGNLREIAIRFVRQESEVEDLWRAGELDVALVHDALLAELPDTDAEVVPLLSVHYVGFRADRPPFANRLVRQAFAHAIDRERLTASLGGLPRAASRGGVIPPSMAGHSHRIGLRFDLERARSLLAEAGYPDGKGLPELELLAPAGGEAADALVEQWAELGARIRIRARGDRLGLPWTVGDSDLWFNGWTADYPDPDGVFRGLFAPGVEPFYHDEEIDELVQRARSLQDQSERLRLYHELDRLWVAEHAAIVPIAYAREMTLRRPWVDRLPINALRRPHFDQVVIRRSAPRSA